MKRAIRPRNEINYILILAICGLSLVCGIAIVVSGKPNQTGNAKKQGTEQKPNTSVTLINNESPETHPEKTNDNPPHWYAAIKRPEWWLVVAAFLTLFFIGWQAWETRRAAQATQKSTEGIEKQVGIMERQTKAAEAAAEAYVSGERAWLVGELEPLAVRYSDRRWYRFVGDNPVALTTNEIIAGEHFRYKVRFSNLGKTPALIVKYDLSCKRSKHPDCIIDFGQPYHFLAAGASIGMEPINIGEYVRTLPNREFLYIEGKVSYRHVFSKTDVTEESFVYVFSQDKQALKRIAIPPEAYEKAQNEEKMAG